MCYNMDKPVETYSMKKMVIKDHIFYASLYIKYPELANPYRQGAD